MLKLQNRKKIIPRIVIALSVAITIIGIFATAISQYRTYADSEDGYELSTGTGTTCIGNSCNRPCDMTVTTITNCGYAAWVYYDFANPNPALKNYTLIGNDGIRIAGSDDGTFPGGTLTGCSAVGAKGVYVYQVLVNKNHANSQGTWAPGDPIGVASIGDNGSKHSEYFGGTQKYSSAWGVSWSEAKEKYESGYDPKGLGWGPNSRLGMFCGDPTKKPPTTPPPPPVPVASCEKNSISGNTNGKTWVINYDRENSWVDGTTYAKPGDNIQFSHSLCYGAQAVKTNDNTTQGGGSDISHDYSNGSSSPSVAVEALNAIGSYHFPADKQQNWFYISTNGNYSFINNTSRLTSPLYLTKNTSRPPELTDMVDYINPNGQSYSFTVLSPSNVVSAGDTYSCSIAEFLYAPFRAPSYQLPGAASGIGGCNSQSVELTSVGKSIEQTIHYNYVQAWTTISSWPKGYCYCNAACGCDGNGRKTPEEADGLVRYTGGYVSGANGFTHYFCSSHTCYYSGTTCDYGPCPCSGYDPVYTTIGGVKVQTGTKCVSNPNCSGPTTHWTESSKGVWYPIRMQDLGERTDNANVIIPYNFNTRVGTGMLPAVSFLGEGINVSATWGIEPRNNSYVRKNGGATYATMTPPDAKVRVVEFVIGPDAEPGNIAGGIASIGDSAPALCGYFGSYLAGQCNELKLETVAGLNKRGDYNGDASAYSGTRTIPDLESVPVGSKYCVASAIYPSGSGDSHQNNTGYDTTWKVSALNCTTIAKKPSFQSWGAGMYSDGQITAAISKKKVGTGLGDWTGATRIFGSWEEYGLIARGKVSGFASGATLGYSPILNPANSGASTSLSSDCSRNPMTLDTCNGNSSTKITDPSITTERLRSRYIPSDSEIAGDSNACLGASGGTCKKLNNGATYFGSSGNATLSGFNITPGENQTYVINVAGTLRITGDICYGNNYGACSGSSTYKLLGGQTGTIYGDIKDVPQVIIFAGNVEVDAEVSQLDAWIITEGRLNTCGYSNGAQVIANASEGTININSGICDKTLLFNGPVYARVLLLNRTAGANASWGYYEPGNFMNQNIANDGSVTPGEIFHLRPDVYFWAYSQAQNYSQAVVTYTRELAPRY